MKVAFIQTSPEFGDVKANVEAAVKRITRLDAGLVVLPELFSTGYQFRNRSELLELAEEVPGGYAVKRLAEAAEAGKAFIVAGVAEREGRKAYNSAVLVGPRGHIGTYRKAHLFWDEKKIFTRGDTPFAVYKAGNARIGMMICFDWLFPEAARTLALMGADIICHPSNLVLPYCPQAMITRSLENRVFTITANRVGTEDRVRGKKLAFIGTSQVTSPDGELLARAGRTRAGSCVVEIDPRRARSKLVTPVNDCLGDRRKDLFKL
ncbi:MAG TPA: acyltransferase [Deltaproteobacteria bacterium]|nr:MAG: acyltransferase [Deltaproteobacteria bacterium GWA2_55_82]OGQ64175.1 MAG: acyltransferase [Deltaproteobacteria bacterium RIFCSPLOWO2_02_FULL_55_12]OIJ74628.1 MAG: acyltransferase [Deltaproteobacteria bacterium GWC2_55_46]HBG46428.1 acyltransferase [Deltaproteobacteria bacterium]HCY10640.1 acyltransferase [Deltaproteobacteria bacterium]